ncbi:MAG: chemotaxis protein CheD [Gemmatimonadota bacterium]
MTMSEVIVRLGAIEVGTRGQVLRALGLGSCVAIILHDAEAKVGGMAHVMLPAAALTRRADKPGTSPDTAVPALVAQMTAAGASPRRLTARLVGGASMFQNLFAPGTIQIGERNVLATRQALLHAGIPLVAQAVGGAVGRSVSLEVDSGRVTITTVAHGSREL